jgi:hypothetical protein
MPENSKKPGIKAIVRMISPTGTIPPDHPYVQMMKQRYGVNVDIRVFKTEEEAVADAEKNPPEMEENSETDPMARMLSDSAVPPSLAELAAMLAAGINEKMQQEEARQKQPPPTSWGDFLRFKLRNCVQVPIGGVVSAITGKLPAELQSSPDDRTDKRLALLQHGLAHFVIGVVGKGNIPEWLVNWHRKLVSELKPDNKQQKKGFLQSLREGIVTHMTMSMLSDAEIAKMGIENMQPSYELGSEPWEWCAQVRHRLERAGGGPLDMEDVGKPAEPKTEPEPAKEEKKEEGTAPAAKETVLPQEPEAPPGSEPFVPTPKPAEFDQIMKQMITQRPEEPAPEESKNSELPQNGKEGHE